MTLFDFPDQVVTEVEKPELYSYISWYFSLCLSQFVLGFLPLAADHKEIKAQKVLMIIPNFKNNIIYLCHI